MCGHIVLCALFHPVCERGELVLYDVSGICTYRIEGSLNKVCGDWRWDIYIFEKRNMYGSKYRVHPHPFSASKRVYL